MIWQTKSTREIETLMKTDIKHGLGEKAAESRLSEHGFNELENKKKTNLLASFLMQFNDFMIIVLLAAAGISFISSYLEGKPDFTEPLIIFAIVVLNAVLGIVQELKAEKSLEALQKMTAPVSKVKRNGKIMQMPTKNLVPGDIIMLEAGDLVPADARLVSCSNLRVDEASLTGESVPAEKDAACICKETCSLGDMKNLVFSGSMVSYGRGEAIVFETGMGTQVGRIAKMIMVEESPETPLQKKLAHTGRLLGIGALIICALVFIIGVLNKIAYFEMFMTSVSLAVAAIPEGLPAIVTIMLAIGVQRMARRNAIVRKLPAVETLGSATVICSDKTGTLTQNKMKVVEISNGFDTLKINSKETEELFKNAALCNDTVINSDGEALGDPTEKALVIAAAATGIKMNEIRANALRVADLPFDSKRKLMSTVHKIKNGGFRIITKGAPEFLLEKCTHYMENGQAVRLTKETRSRILKKNAEMAQNALRVIAVATRQIDRTPHKIAPETIETELVFGGLLGLLDPPREEVTKAVKMCKRAGIKPVMITGDHILTACAVAKKIGIMDAKDKAMTGEQLDCINETILIATIESYSVFARVSPAHKVKIVKAFQALGHVVAMTGDGVNDAPALKAADIGCAMGITGTDVAKNAADIVLTDDNFATIVEAVKEGRGIYANIKKSAHFLLSSNIGEILTIFVGLLMGMPSPLLAIQLLWVNLVTDSLPAIALGLDPADKRNMERKPYNNKKSLFSDGHGVTIGVEGCMIGLLALVAFTIGYRYFETGGNPILGRTMAFAVLSVSQLVHSFNMKSERSVLNESFFNNKYMFYAFFVGLALQISVISIPQLAKIFLVVPLSLKCWGIVAALSLVPIILVELQKAVNNTFTGQSGRKGGRLLGDLAR